MSNKERDLRGVEVVREANAIYDGGRKSIKTGTTKELTEQIVGLATWVLGSTKAAKAFLGQSHPMLGGLTPLKAAETDESRRAVERILFNIEYSLPA